MIKIIIILISSMSFVYIIKYIENLCFSLECTIFWNTISFLFPILISILLFKYTNFSKYVNIVFIIYFFLIFCFQVKDKFENHVCRRPVSFKNNIISAFDSVYKLSKNYDINWILGGGKKI
jgi:hypothetical protein